VKFYNATNRVDAAIGRQQGRIDALVADGVDLATKVTAPTTTIKATRAARPCT